MMYQYKERELQLLPEFEGIFNNAFETLYPEMELEAMPVNVSRSDKSYIKWVQESLNKILGLNLLVDGDAGSKTRSAIRSFQAKNGLKQVGYVGPKTEVALIKAGALVIPTTIIANSSSSPSSSESIPVTNIATLKNNIVAIALGEWNRWDNGKRTEYENDMLKLIAGYYKTGIGSLPEKEKFPGSWSAAFISYVMRKAGSGKSFPYSSNHSIYSYRAKNNRIANIVGSFMAYHISELKPQLGDIIVYPRDSNLSYDTLSKEGKKGHGDIIVEINTNGVYVVGGNVGNSTSGKRGVTVNRKKPLKMSADGYLTATKYDIIIRAGGASPSEIRSRENEFEILPEYEIIFNEITY
jgi:peptidoglycan hydrolase-like protein with peptidoglycan-binding domain